MELTFNAYFFCKAFLFVICNIDLLSKTMLDSLLIFLKIMKKYFLPMFQRDIIDPGVGVLVFTVMQPVHLDKRGDTE